MDRPYILNLTDQEKAEIQETAILMGMSMEEFINFALSSLLEDDDTGVWSGDE
jgi:hypothetical protein